MRLRTPAPTGPVRVLRVLPLLLAVVGAVGPAAAQSPAAPAPARTAPAPGQVLSLPEAIELALRQQPTIRSAEQGRGAAMARVPQAQSSYYPRLDVVGSAGRSQTFSSTLNQAFQSNSISAVIQGRQLIYDFGKTGALVDEARANVRFSEGELERVRDVVVVNVRQAYYQLLQAQRLVAVADAQVGRADLNLRSAQGFFEVGTKPKSDVTKAEVEVANARVAQIRARNLVQFNQVNLASTLGLEATTPLQIQDILNYEPVTIDPAALRTEALANRPELAQARARVDAALRTVGLTIRDVQVVSIANADVPVALKNKALDAGLAGVPFATQAVTEGWAVPLLQNFEPGAATTVFLYSGKLIKERPAVAERFTLALLQGARAMQGAQLTSEKNLAIWTKYTGVRAETIKSSTPLVYSPDLEIFRDNIARQEKSHREAGFTDYQTPVPVEQMLDESFRQKALARLGPYRP